MKELNELVELANKALVAGQGSPEMVDFRVTANPDNILAIAAAFRELEQEKKAADRYAERLNTLLDDRDATLSRYEAKLAELEQQEPVAWRYRTTNIYGEPNQGWTFSDSDSLMGLYQPLYAHPAPAADLAELMQDESGLADRHIAWLNTLQRPMFSDEDWEELTLYTWLAFRDSFRIYRAAILSKMENHE